MKQFNSSSVILCLIFLMLLSSLDKTYGQCADASHLSTLSYDTLFNGGGNSNYDASFPQFDTNRIYIRIPQFDPSKGTLMEVDLQIIINVKYGYKVENSDNVSSVTRVKMNRSDVITNGFSTLPPNDKNKTVATNVLGASDGVAGSGPDYAEAGPLYAYNHYPIDFTITNNLAGFLGNGQVNFNYETTTDLFSSGSNSVFTSSTEDSIYFRLTYKYCLTSLLPAEINNFTAIKSGPVAVQLSWNVPNDNTGNRYEMQKSTDGVHYTTFDNITAKSGASNSYLVLYTTSKEDRDKLFFRIKQSESNGSLKYSIIKTVSLDYISSAMKVYPTVTKTTVNIYFPYAANANYQVSIISLTGQVMQQNEFTKTNLISVPLNAGLKTGLYIVSVVNKQTSERQQSKLVIE
jgi:hypothetical protein